MKVRTHGWTDQEVWTCYVKARYRPAAIAELRTLGYEEEPQSWFFLNIGKDLEPSDPEARGRIFEALASACEFDA